MKNSELSKRISNFRVKQGVSQEELANKAGLSLRTIQRIENGESMPRGDTLKRLAVVLQVTSDDLIEWRILENKNVLKILSLSQLGYLGFPLLGVIIPLGIWILNKDKTKYVDSIGKSILNFQITWTIILCFFYVAYGVNLIFHLGIPMFSLLWIVGGLYVYNLIVIVGNTISIYKINRVKYMPAFTFLS